MKHSAITDQLIRIRKALGWGDDCQSRHFLEYIVNETLAGNKERIKAYSIAVSALGKSEDFDPQLDSTVRVLAKRVREKMADYYRAEGMMDDVIISIPTGTYQPRFTYRKGLTESECRPKTEATRARDLVGLPRVAVLECRFSGDDEVLRRFSEAFESELVFALHQFEMLTVCSASNADLLRPDSYFIRSKVHQSSPNSRLHVQLVSQSTGSSVCACAIDLNFAETDHLSVCQEIATNLAAQLAAPFGYLHKNFMLGCDVRDVDQASAYECATMANKYYVDATPANFERALIAAKRAVEITPNFASSWAVLSDLYSEDYRIAYSGFSKSKKSLGLAVECAKRAIQLNPDAASGHLALSTALFSLGDIERAIRSGDKALELNPMNHTMRARYGQCRAYAGDWGSGIELIQEATSKQGGSLDLHLYALAESAFLNGAYQSALNYLEQTKPTSIYFQPMFRAINFASLGLRSEANDAVAELLKRDPNFTLEEVRMTMQRDVHSGFVDHVVDGLKCAGLKA